MKCEHLFVTSQGSAHGRFTSAIQQRNRLTAEMLLARNQPLRRSSPTRPSEDWELRTLPAAPARARLVVAWRGLGETRARPLASDVVGQRQDGP